MMDVRTDRRTPSWRDLDGWPTSKQRAAATQAVRRLLDALAPERPPARAAQPRTAVQRFRSPHGCILQGETGAVSVSWFPGTTAESSLGELHIIVWHGTVSRPGATERAASRAAPVAERLLSPVETMPDAWAWRAADGTVVDGGALADQCLTLLADHA